MNSFLENLIKKRNKTDFVILILLGVMVMIVAMPSGTKKTQTQQETQTPVIQNETDEKQQLEEQLQKLLEKMDGVGKVRVMLTFSDDGEDKLDKNITENGTQTEETTVVYDTKDAQQPYVIRREKPKVEGVVVVAEGGGNVQTVTQISNAVMSLFSVEAHKVVVVKMSVQEE